MNPSNPINPLNPIIIRKARPADLETLLRFEQAIITVERPLNPTMKEGQIHYYDLRAMITANDVGLVVAEQDGVLIGSGYARIEAAKPYLKHSVHAYLGFMYVEPAHRGKGINQMIIAALKTWAHSRNVTELRLDVYHANANAIKAYEKAGFKQHLINMRLGF
jgi:GNAT superfamily N-acetyltransferase